MKIDDAPMAAQLFGSVLKRKILYFLFMDQAPVSERQLAKILGVSHTAVNKSMQQLLNLNAIKGTTVGKAFVWELNKASFTYPLIGFFFERLNVSPLDFVKKEIAEAVRKEVEGLNTETTIRNMRENRRVRPKILAAYIFGSIADGTSTPDSDIDVLLILEEEHRNDVLRDILREGVGMQILEKTGNKVSFHIYCQKNIDAKEPKWLEKAMAEGIRVY